MEQLRRQLDWQKKKTKFAWAKFFEAQRTQLTDDTAQVVRVRTMVQHDEQVPQFIKDELKQLLTELNKRVQCPICLDDMQPSDLGISNCGHKYCQSCLDTLKAQPDPKCAVCRRKIY